MHLEASVKTARAPWAFWSKNRYEFDRSAPLGGSKYEPGDMVVSHHFRDGETGEKAIGRVVARIPHRNETWVDWVHPNGVQVASVTELDSDMMKLPRTKKAPQTTLDALDQLNASKRTIGDGAGFPEMQGALIAAKNYRIGPKSHNYKVGDLVLQKSAHGAWYGTVTAIDPNSNRIAAEWQHSTSGHYMSGVNDAKQVEPIGNTAVNEDDIRKNYELPDLRHLANVTASRLDRFRRI